MKNAFVKTSLSLALFGLGLSQAHASPKCSTDQIPNGVYAARFDGKKEINMMYHFSAISPKAYSVVLLTAKAEVDSNSYQDWTVTAEMDDKAVPGKCALNLAIHKSRGDAIDAGQVVILSISEDTNHNTVISGYEVDSIGKKSNIEMTRQN